MITVNVIYLVYVIYKSNRVVYGTQSGLITIQDINNFIRVTSILVPL